MDTWVISCCEHQYTLVCMDMFSSPLGVYLEVKLLSHVVTLGLTFRGTAKLFSKAASSSTHSCHRRMRFPMSSIPCQVLLLSFSFSLPSGCAVVSHWGVELHFPKD